MRHARAAGRLSQGLAGFDDEGSGLGGWVILLEPELHLGTEPDIVVPDLAGWRRQRMPTLPLDAAFLSLAPDWVCEIASPSTKAFDRAEKLPVYAREGVAHAWLLDPDAALLEVFELEGGRWVLAQVFSGNGGVRARPFDAHALMLSSLWAP